MKKIKIILCFFKKNPFLLLFVLLEMTLSMVLFANQLGELQYRRYALDIYRNSELVNCDHFTSHVVPGLSDSPHDNTTAVIEAAANTEGVEAVGISRSVTTVHEADLNLPLELQRNYSVTVLTASVFGSLPIELSDGTWQPDEEQSQTAVNVVACGSLAAEYRVGDTVPVVVDGDNGEAASVLELKIVGRVAPPGLFVTLRISSNVFSADDLFESSGCFIAIPTQRNEELFSRYPSSTITDRGMLIRYEKNLDAASLEKARASLRSWGYLTTPEEMIENSEKHIRDDFNERFPMLMFFLIISSFSMITSVIVTQMKMYRNNAIYYLCGATAPRCFLYSGIPAGLVGFLALIANLGWIVYYRMDYDMWRFSRPRVLNGTTAAVVAVYFAVTVLVAILASYYVFRKNTPIESYRKNK